jgi:hypothetical protein
MNTRTKRWPRLRASSDGDLVRRRPPATVVDTRLSSSPSSQPPFLAVLLQQAIHSAVNVRAQAVGPEKGPLRQVAGTHSECLGSAICACVRWRRRTGWTTHGAGDGLADVGRHRGRRDVAHHRQWAPGQRRHAAAGSPTNLGGTAQPRQDNAGSDSRGGTTSPVPRARPTRAAVDIERRTSACDELAAVHSFERDKYALNATLHSSRYLDRRD